MAEIYKVAESWMSIWVRNGPGTRYGRIDVIYGRDNKEYKVSERQNKYWLKIGNGRWVCDRDSNGMMVMKKTGTTSSSTVNPPSEPEPITQVDEESYAYVPDMDIVTSSEAEFITDLENNFTISNIRGIFGMPYQFMESADPRLTNKPGAIGRKYAREIVSNMPLLLITPGKPVFMGSYSEDDKKTILEQFIGVAGGLVDQISDAVLSDKFGKYYSLEPDYRGYYEYVNPMCRIAARVLNVHKYTVDGTRLDMYNWAFKTNEAFDKLFSVYRGCTAWYCDSETSISDSWTNGTAPSMLADKINSLSDYGRELNFILGTAKAETGVALDQFTSPKNLQKNIDNVNDFINSALGQNSVSGIFKTLTNTAQTVVAGGKLVFPEIWSESSFARSYDVRLKLVSPDADDLSLYLNIIVPMLHLLGLVLPRESGGKDTKGHGYISPFLVRGFYKGLFNVDMGIITDMTFTKGKESAWSLSGIPTTVDVSFTIKDLYSDMYMSNMDQLTNNTMTNIILMDYISNLCGVNINEVDVYRGIEMFFMNNVLNRVTDTWHLKIYGRLDQWITNKYQAIFGRF